MVAYNFRERFAPLIASGKKRQTIREIGARRHARPGDALQLYTGMRTRNCRKILADDPKCRHAYAIQLDLSQRILKTTRYHPSPTPVFVIDRVVIDDLGRLAGKRLEAFARADGFDTLADMADFFGRTYGTGIFSGALITW